jgi:hypothetical protein
MKTVKFMAKHASRINLGLTLLYLVMAGCNGYWAYEEFQAQEYKQAVISSFSAGLFVTTFFFFTLTVLQLRTNHKLHEQVFDLIMENHDLSREILILKMPHLAKAIQDDRLGSQEKTNGHG